MKWLGLWYTMVVATLSASASADEASSIPCPNQTAFVGVATDLVTAFREEMAQAFPKSQNDGGGILALYPLNPLSISQVEFGYIRDGDKQRMVSVVVKYAAKYLQISLVPAAQTCTVIYGVHAVGKREIEPDQEVRDEYSLADNRARIEKIIERANGDR